MFALRVIFYGLLIAIYMIATVAFSSPRLTTYVSSPRTSRETPEPQPGTEYCSREAVKTKDGVKHAEKCHKMTPSPQAKPEKPSKVRE